VCVCGGRGVKNKSVNVLVGIEYSSVVGVAYATT